jgi:predicted enzyme related to lactoylglutathione lyase
MADKIGWFEVLGQDPTRLRAFYSELFGWKFQDEQHAGYASVSPEQAGIGGGIGKADDSKGWTTVYANVPDLKTAIGQAERLGGKLLKSITELPGLSFAIIADPEGHPIGLMTMK